MTINDVDDNNNCENQTDEFETYSQIKCEKQSINNQHEYHFKIDHGVNLILRSITNQDKMFFSKDFMYLLNTYLSNVKATYDLYEENQLLNRIIKQIPEAFAYKNLNEKYLYSSHLTDQMYEDKVDSIAGKTVSQVYPKDEILRVRELDNEAINSKTALSKEFKIFTDSGFVDVESLRVPVFDSNQKLEGIISLSRDVTHIKKTEKMLKSNLDFLEIIMSISQKFMAL
ncbi:PAS domain S-box protein [Mariniplasma anaerobium]|nr:PAS domain S-box protein [Mariniplasma anaerobium]